MKINEVNDLLTKTITEEIKKAIIAENDESQKDYYHVMLDGTPIDTFETPKEAENYVSKVKDKHTGKNLIIDKKNYQSYSDMIDFLDELNDKINNEKNINEMKKRLKEQNEMYDSYDDEFREEEETCLECGDGRMEEEMYEMGDDLYEIDPMDEDMYETDFVDERMYSSDDDTTEMMHNPNYMDEEMYEMDEEMYSSEHTEEDMYEMDEEMHDSDYVYEEKEYCSECGSMLNEGGTCNECGKSSMYESKKTIRLTESELTKLIKDMVLESIPGLDVTKRMGTESGKESKKHYGEVNAKMKKYLQFEGNDNPEFPNQIKKGDKVKRENTKQQDEEVAKNKAGLQNLKYDIEPSEQFKKRAKMAVEGHPHMGNAATTEKASIKPSNTSKKPEEAKEKSGNQMKTNTGDKINKQTKDREKDLKSRTIYKKEQVPVKTKQDKKESVNESIEKKALLNEMKRMKDLSSYNKKTQ